MAQRSLAFAVVAAATVLGNAPSWAQTDSWAVYRDDRGTRIEYPRHIFSIPRGRGEQGVGHVFATPDGRARIHMYSIPNANALSPAAFMRSHFPGDRSRLTYDRVARNFFAVSSRRGGMIAYLRCNFSRSAGGTLHCVDLRYPVAEKRAWDAVVTRISRSVRPLPSGS
jgi:hypothetical protein